MAGVAMPQLVKRHAPLLQELGNCAGESPRLRRRSIRLGYDAPIVVYLCAELEHLLGLRELPAPQFHNGHRRNGDGSAFTALGFLFANGAGVALLGAGDDGELACVEIDCLPANGRDLATETA